MLAANVESAGSRGAKGSDMFSLTVLSSTLVTDLTGEKRKPHDPFWSIARVSEYTTSSAVRGDPSENFAPCRSVNVALNPSGATVHAVASSGSTPLFEAFSLTSRSKIWSSTKIEGSSSVEAGSKVSMSAFRAMVIVAGSAAYDGPTPITANDRTRTSAPSTPSRCVVRTRAETAGPQSLMACSLLFEGPSVWSGCMRVEHSGGGRDSARRPSPGGML